MIELNTNVLGTFALKNDGIIKKILFPRDPQKLAAKLREVEKAPCEEEVQLITYLKETGADSIKVKDPERFWGHDLGIKFVEDDRPTDPQNIAADLGIIGDELTTLLSKSSRELTRIKLGEIDQDEIVIQAIASMDDLEESANRLVKRLREWYSLSFPELDSLVKKHILYAQIVNSDSVDVDAGLLAKINETQKKTFGVKFTKSDENAVKSLSKAILKLYLAREEIESYITEVMGELAPNISALSGPVLGARLISLSGGLNRMSILPASTIQVLGAEGAFFRFLKTGKLPPKHGIIFQLPEIRSAPKNIRGRISRTFAAKLVIAAKVDRFNGEFIGDKLRKDFLKKLEKMR